MATAIPGHVVLRVSRTRGLAQWGLRSSNKNSVHSPGGGCHRLVPGGQRNFCGAATFGQDLDTGHRESALQACGGPHGKVGLGGSFVFRGFTTRGASLRTLL